MMSWYVCPSCSRVGLAFDTVEETEAARLNPKYVNIPFSEDFCACNICGEFVCPRCIRDHEGVVQEWCVSCERKEKGLTVNHPDPRLSISKEFL